jgi:periplasmic divalent cation tolerance protein
MKEPSLRLLMTTFSDRESAAAVIRSLLEERLIACGSILPGVTSLYHWEGAIKEAPEVVVLMKTEQAHSKRCMVRLQELHPYEVPEIILLDPEAVSRVYAGWVMEVLGRAKF